MPVASRIGAIDFWRGLVLIAILVDHVPGAWLEYATPRNYGFSDSAEAFVFLSGLSVGAIYVPRARKQGFLAMAASCLKRALKLYGAHIAMTVAALWIFGIAGGISGLDELLTAHGRFQVFFHPEQGLSGIVLLSHQIGYFNILPLYIALMVWAPLAVELTLASPRAAVATSAAIYAIVRIFEFNLPNWPEPGGWFFDPLAWQFLFTVGVYCAVRWREGPPRRQPLLVGVCLIVVAFGAVIITNGLGLAPGLRDAASPYLDASKQMLGLARLAHFFAVAYLLTIAPGVAYLVAAPVGQRLQQLGRHSLAVFAFSSLLAALGQAAMSVGSLYVSDPIVHFMGMAYTIGAVALMFPLASRLDCQNSSPSPPALPLVSRSRWRARSASERSSPAI